MPVEISASIRPLSQPEFHAIDEKVMRIVFDVHNYYGRLFDEIVYKEAIAARFRQAGLGSAQREVRVRLTHRSFAKDLFIDLLFEQGAMLEAKTAEALVPAHRNQTLTYLFLSGLQHARLVNLRPEKVEYEFVSTKLTLDARKRFRVIDAGWERVNSESLWLKEQIFELLSDWGTFLDVSLYREAITHLLGGAERVFSRIEVSIGKGVLAFQRTHLLTADTAFVLTAVAERLDQIRDHHTRWLRHTPLRYIQWINFHRHQITLETLRNPGPR